MDSAPAFIRKHGLGLARAFLLQGLSQGWNARVVRSLSKRLHEIDWAEFAQGDEDETPDVDQFETMAPAEWAQLLKWARKRGPELAEWRERKQAKRNRTRIRHADAEPRHSVEWEATKEPAAVRGTAGYIKWLKAGRKGGAS